MTNRDLLLGQIPEALRARAEVHNLGEDSCLFSVRSDLAMDGAARETWLIVTKSKIFSVPTGNQDSAPVAGPFLLKDVQKVRSFQTVGSAFLQLLIDGVYVDVVRYSNARRETFGTVRAQLERMVEGRPLQTEALARPSELVCPKCGLPLPGRRAVCPRCAG